MSYNNNTISSLSPHTTNDHHTATASAEPRSPEEQASRARLLRLCDPESWTRDDRLDFLLTETDPCLWTTDQSLEDLAAVWDNPAVRSRYLTRWSELKKPGRWLEEAVEAVRKRSPALLPNSPSSPAPPRFATIKASTLHAKPLPPQQWIIPDILPAGATLFVGRGKDGKSLLAWNLCLAVATGGKALSAYDVEEGDVLYLALEDGERRAQKRLREQMAHANMDTAPERLELVLWDAPRIGEGFEAGLLTWLDEHPQARLVVVDILEKVRPRRTHNGSVYADDYAALAPLQRIAQDRNIAVLIVHHSNKTRPEDFRDTASGSMGLIGACDTFWGLQRIAGEPDAALRITGRDVDEQDLALRFAEGFWTKLGQTEEYRLSQTSREVLDALQAAKKPLTYKQIAALMEVKEGTMRKHLWRMAERGYVRKWGEDYYIPSSTPPDEREMV